MKKVIPFNKTVHFKTMIAEVTDIEIGHTLKVTSEQTIEGDILVDGTYKMTEASQLEEEFHYTLPFTIEVDDKYDITNSDIAIHDFYFEIINEEDLKVNVELEISKVEEKEVNILEENIEKEENIQEIEEIKQEEIRSDQIEKNEILEEKENMEIEQVNTLNENSIYQEAVEVTLPSKEELFGDIEISNTPNKKTVTLTNTPLVLEKEKEEEKETTTKSELSNNVTSIFSSINQEETFVTYYVYIVREQDTVDSIIEKYQTTRENLSSYNNLSEIKVGSKVIIPCSNE